jgi:uncharacterized protein (TIGR02597 family)
MIKFAQKPRGVLASEIIHFDTERFVRFNAFRRTIPTLLLVAALFLTRPLGAISVATDPVGFAAVMVSANTTKALSLPFNDQPDYAAPISTVVRGKIKTIGAGWSPNAFGPFVSNPHVIRMVSGVAVGRQFRIASNTSDTLTLIAGSDLTGVAATDRYQIFATATLQSLFGPTGIGLNTNINPVLADNIQIFGTSSWVTYYNDGTHWIRKGSQTNANTVSIPPEQGFLFVRRPGTDYVFAVPGVVPITNLKSDFPANKTTSFGNRFPLDTTLVDLGLDQLVGWNKNADSALADLVQIRGPSKWTTYYFDPTTGVNGWVKLGGQIRKQNPIIPAGTSLLVIRRAGANLTLDQPLPYAL